MQEPWADLQGGRNDARRPKAWAALEVPLRAGQPVGLQLDCFHLEYFSRPIHFAGHFVAAHGFDEQDVLLVDTAPQGSLQRASRANVEKARFAKGPMAAKARSLDDRGARTRRSASRQGARARAIRANAQRLPVAGIQGRVASRHPQARRIIAAWLEIAKDPADDLALAAMLMEKAGTGGSLFRNFYRDFLVEAREYLARRDAPKLNRGAMAFRRIGGRVGGRGRVDRIQRGRTGDAAPLRDAAQRCRRVAEVEVEAMRLLAKI